MASFYGGCGEVPPQPSSWRRPDASRFINNAREGGQVTTLPLPSRHSITSSARMEIEAMFLYGRRGQSVSPLPVALVEGRRRAQPGTPDTLGARKAKVLHQINQVLA